MYNTVHYARPDRPHSPKKSEPVFGRRVCHVWASRNVRSCKHARRRICGARVVAVDSNLGRSGALLQLWFGKCHELDTIPARRSATFDEQGKCPGGLTASFRQNLPSPACLLASERRHRRVSRPSGAFRGGVVSSGSKF